jgi:hypothetical protein
MDLTIGSRRSLVGVLVLVMCGCSPTPPVPSTTQASQVSPAPTPASSVAPSPMPSPSGPYSDAALEGFIAQVEAQRDWFTSIGVELFDPDIDALTNTVRVRYIAKDDSAGPAILAHFGNPSWMTPKWYGPPAWAGPWGRLVIRFTDRAGRPLASTADITCSPVAVDPSVGYESLPKGTLGTSQCEFDHFPAVAWRVDVHFTDSHDDNQHLQRLVTVPADGTGAATVQIRR